MRTECPECGTDDLFIHSADGRESTIRCAACGWDSVEAADDDVSSDILETDPDPEGTTMTDTDTVTVTTPTIITYGGYKIAARNGPELANLLDKASRNPVTGAFVQKARKAEGTGTVGLYVEAVAFTAAGAPFTHMKFFVIDNHLFFYNRMTGDTRANWRYKATADLLSALTTVQATIGKPNVRVLGHPVLVELTADDLSAVETGQMPPARFRGQYRIERDYGRYDFEMEVVTAPIPSSLTSALRKASHVVPDTAPA